MEKRIIHYAHMGHGLCFYDINNEINGDYEKVAFADSNRVVQLYATNLNTSDKNLIFDSVKNEDGGVSICQPECKIFNIPADKNYEYIKGEKYYWPHLNGVKITK